MRAVATPTQIGSILAGRRKFLKLSQSELATRVGISQNRLSVLEKNSSTLTAKQLLALLNALGLQMSIADRAKTQNDVEW